MKEHLTHTWVFLRSETKDGYTKKVDVFFCSGCLEYKEVVVWQERRF